MPVCLNHTDRQATVKCATCFKPLCGECVLRHGRQVFCSKECLANTVRTSGILSRFIQHEKQSSRRQQQMTAAIIFVLSLFALILVLTFLR
jgi:hypothetical protein